MMDRKVTRLKKSRADFSGGVSVVFRRSGIDGDSDTADAPFISRDFKSNEGEKRDDGMDPR
jgi:hypothetical protein